jgi:hypothetical protein
MRIGILRSGLMGGKLGTIFARAGRDVVFGVAVIHATGRATLPVAFFRASNRSRALRIAGQFD